MKRIREPLDALMMVGGFSGSEYLFKRVDVNVIGRSWGQKTDRHIPRIDLVIGCESLPGPRMPTLQRSGAQHNMVLPDDHWSRLSSLPRPTS